MKILFDGLLLFLNNGQVGNYSRSIVDNLIKYSDLQIDIVKDYEINSNKYKNNQIELFLNRKHNDFSNLNMIIKKNNYELYHCLNNGFSIPKNFNLNYIMNINNLLPTVHEDLCSSKYLNNFFSRMPYSVMNCSSIICPSYFTKRCFLDSFSMNKEKIFVNYGTVSSFYDKLDSFLASTYVESKFNINNEFIVFSGDFHRRKRIDSCIILFSKLKSHIPGLKFLILNYSFKDSDYMNELNNLITKLGLHSDVIFISKISIMDKVNIFNSCLFFLDLSIYEDTNLDIVEAFACQAPIVCSNIGLYKEYFGDYAYYYDNLSKPLSLLNYISHNDPIDFNMVLDKFKSEISLKTLIHIYNNI